MILYFEILLKFFDILTKFEITVHNFPNGCCPI